MKLENGLDTLISESPLMTVYKSNSVSIRPQVTYLEDFYRKQFYQNGK
jgi:hypothetical protein